MYEVRCVFLLLLALLFTTHVQGRWYEARRSRLLSALVQSHPLFGFFERWAGLPLSHDGDPEERTAPDERGTTPVQHVRDPVMFVPPLGGVRLEYRQSYRAKPPHFWCWRVSSWSLAWLNPLVLLPGAYDCWVSYMRLLVDCTGKSASPEGVQVQPVPGFDSAMSILPGEGAPVYELLATRLEEKGWQRDVDLGAHLYDFRQSPIDWLESGGSFHRLKREVEAMVASCGGRPVIFITLSMGGPYLNLFLTKIVDRAWKEQHVKAFISISGFWGGAAEAPLTLVSGMAGYTRSRVEATKEFLWHMPSLSWISPSPAIPSAPLVHILATNRTYGSEEVGQLLEDAGAHQAALLWRLTRQYTVSQPPDVPLYCLYSRGLKTLSGLVYSTEDLSRQPQELVYTEGDGTVPLDSITVCDQWVDQQSAPVVVKVFPGVRHADLVRNRQVLAYLVQVVSNLSGGSDQQHQGASRDLEVT